MNTRSPALVRSVLRALAVLELIAESPEGLTLTDISHRLDIPLSTVHGLAASLVHGGYLVRKQDTLRYHLGPKVGVLVAAFRGQLDLASMARPMMDRLRQATGETISLCVLEGNEVVFIDKRAGEGQVQVVNPVGTRLPAHATASGKVMLAYLLDDAIDRLYPDPEWPGLTPYTITNKRDLKQRLAEIREQGYAYDDQESELGLLAIASCIRDANGYPVGALNIVSPLFRTRDVDLGVWRRLVMEAAAEVSRALGFPST